MVRSFHDMLRRFRREEKGAVLLIFTIFIVPVLLVVAVATDFAQALLVKQQLTSGVDAAALTISTLPGLTESGANAKAEAYIRAHYPGKIGTLKSFAVTRDGNTTGVTATAEVETTFMRIAGHDKLTVTVSSQATRQFNNLEVVMVLDNSGSMAQIAPDGGTKLAALKTAAKDLVETLMGSDATSENVRIGLVPFMGAVNVGVARGTWWLDEDNPAALNYENIGGLPAGASLFKLFDDMHSRDSAMNWRGCVRARTEPCDLTDTPPDPAANQTLFTPYFAPDEPGGEPDWYNPDDILLPAHPFKNNYIGGADGDDMNNVGKYAEEAALNTARMGPNARCPEGPIMPLTNARMHINAALDSMTAVGLTVIPEGLAWGWRVISPGEPFTQGAPYSDSSTLKAIVLMTDGDNQVTPGGNQAQDPSLGSYFSAYGYQKQSETHLGANPTTTLDGKLAALCDNIKAIKQPDGKAAIAIYTIVLGDANGNPNGDVRDLFQDCATDKTKAFETATAGGLLSTFEEIASSLNSLRISK